MTSFCNQYFWHSGSQTPDLVMLFKLRDISHGKQVVHLAVWRILT